MWSVRTDHKKRSESRKLFWEFSADLLLRWPNLELQLIFLLHPVRWLSRLLLQIPNGKTSFPVFLFSFFLRLFPDLSRRTWNMQNLLALIQTCLIYVGSFPFSLRSAKVSVHVTAVVVGRVKPCSSAPAQLPLRVLHFLPVSPAGSLFGSFCCQRALNRSNFFSVARKNPGMAAAWQRFRSMTAGGVTLWWLSSSSPCSFCLWSCLPFSRALIICTKYKINKKDLKKNSFQGFKSEGN